MDKEYVILDEIVRNENITQRELSSKSGLSLGSVNLLMNKMIKDGLIKIKQVPMNRVAYMLTPKGMAEKVNKTYQYIKYHYNYINDTKTKLIEALTIILERKQNVYIYCEQDALSELVKSVAKEFKTIKMINNQSQIIDNIPIVVLTMESFYELKNDKEVINLLEYI